MFVLLETWPHDDGTHLVTNIEGDLLRFDSFEEALAYGKDNIQRPMVLDLERLEGSDTGLGEREWLFEEDRFILKHALTHYEIELDRCTHSAEILDRIVQVSKKSWAGTQTVGALVRRLDGLFQLQASVCSGGVDQPISPRLLFRNLRLTEQS